MSIKGGGKKHKVLSNELDPDPHRDPANRCAGPLGTETQSAVVELYPVEMRHSSKVATCRPAGRHL